MTDTRKVIVVAGPTASGKSDFAVDLALSKAKGYAPFVDGEIISADSRQVYRGLDIGTGKITKEEMGGVPHYMLDIIDVNEHFSVAEYARIARPILEDILARGKTPIICGGTGQYIDALIYDISVPAIPPDNELRQQLEARTSEDLFEELKRKDPRRAESIDKHNKVRLVRALEIIAQRGVVPELPEAKLAYDVEFHLRSPSRDVLRERITKRMEKRLELGMVKEVEQLMKKGFTSETMKRFGLEYVTIGKFLEGTITEEHMKEELVNKSMQYARRQQTWNKKYHPFARLVDVA